MPHFPGSDHVAVAVASMTSLLMYISFSSSFEGKNQSVYPFKDKFAQISAAIPVVVQPASISVVFCTPVPMAVPSAPEITVP